MLELDGHVLIDVWFMMKHLKNSLSLSREYGKFKNKNKVKIATSIRLYMDLAKQLIHFLMFLAITFEWMYVEMKMLPIVYLTHSLSLSHAYTQNGASLLVGNYYPKKEIANWRILVCSMIPTITWMTTM